MLREAMVDTYELGSISQHDQVVTELSRRAKEIAGFYKTMIEGGLPERLAGRIVVEWARASLQSAGEAPCGCDCEICRGEG